jgi:hypothetical protein
MKRMSKEEFKMHKDAKRFQRKQLEKLVLENRAKEGGYTVPKRRVNAN